MLSPCVFQQNKCSVLSVLCESVKVMFSEYDLETLARPMYQWRTKLRFENSVVGLNCLAPGVRLISTVFPGPKDSKGWYVSSLPSQINAAWKDVRGLWRLVVATERAFHRLGIGFTRTFHQEVTTLPLEREQIPIAGLFWHSKLFEKHSSYKQIL